MRRVNDIFVSTVLVVDDNMNHVSEKVEQISKQLKSRYSNYEVLVIDNGLNFKELEKIRSILTRVACIRIIRLSRSLDTDTAIFAGIEAAVGDYICVLYNNDPAELVPKFIEAALATDIVFGIATNLKRKSALEGFGARLFYWYSTRYLHIDIPRGSSYFICMNRAAANALTHSGRYMRHVRHMAKLVGFTSVNYEYKLPKGGEVYAKDRPSAHWSRAIDLISNYSSHPLRLITYFGVVAGLFNIVYAIYVVIINLSENNIARGWTTLSLQSSLMFFILFVILALLSEYMGKILNETQQEPPYHIMEELNSRITIADETRRNVAK